MSELKLRHLRHSKKQNEIPAMRMDATQRGWAMASLGILAISAVVYLVYAWNAPGDREVEASWD